MLSPASRRADGEFSVTIMDAADIIVFMTSCNSRERRRNCRHWLDGHNHKLGRVGRINDATKPRSSI